MRGLFRAILLQNCFKAKRLLANADYFLCNLQYLIHVILRKVSHIFSGSGMGRTPDTLF